MKEGLTRLNLDVVLWSKRFIMKKFFAVFGMFLSCYTFAQGNRVSNSINYIKINSYTSPSINIVSIDDFLGLMNDNKTKDVFFTDSLFLVQGNSVMYILNNNGYKNLFDYKNGDDKKFINGESYYFALENNLPNQDEVDFYRKEGFITNTDYQEATRLGFTHSDVTKKGIYGLITQEDIQENIRYLNIIYYLKSYKNWQMYEDQKARENTNQTTLNQYGYNDRDRVLREQENARLQRERREQEGQYLLENTSLDTIVSKFEKHQIKKLDNFSYYLINIPPDSDKDSLFYYICKFCQYSNITEYKNNDSNFTIKGTEQILRKFSFDSIDAFLDGDSKNVVNGNDYNLMVGYGQITLEQLTQNRSFVNELESIKRRYLQNIDLTKFNGFRYNYSYNSPKANVNGIIAFVIYNLIKQPKGVPISYTNFMSNVQKEYSNNSIYQKISFDQNIIPVIFENIPQIKNMFVVSTDSFYLR